VEDPIEQARITEQLERLYLLRVRELAALHALALLLPLLQKFLELEQHFAKIALDDPLLYAKLVARKLRVVRSLPRRVQLQRVHVEGAALALAEDVDAQGARQRLVRKATYPPAPIAKTEGHLIAARRGCRARRGRRRRRLGSVVGDLRAELVGQAPHLTRR